ncbi:uncharacterized protein [Centroberyx affinis]|uniref:uncharacterized protein n=1 Tax=Centroberyx affinis TaxID=166261 RepID=UPI003A5B9EBF
MYLWRCSIAIILGLVWYFSDCGRTVTQYFLCFLCCFSTPLLFRSIGRESSTQTDEVDKDKILQESCVEEQLFAYDFADGESRSTQAEIPLESQYPHVKKSLQQVFECAYGQLVLPWYGVPEPCESQPLHRVLSREFDFVIDQVIKRATDLDVCEAVVGSIRILTQHLHNAKHSDREPLFGSRSEEVAVLREFSEVLVRNVFPESLWGQDVNRCALNEIVALKGLELLVTWLSDPDNLNQLVVSQLDSVTPKSSVEELCGSDLERVSLASHEGEGEGSEVSLEGAENSVNRRSKSKKKGNKLKEGWSKFVDKMKSKKAKKKKMKKMEQELMFRVMSIQGDFEGEGSSREGSVHSQQDSDGEDSDLENYLASVQEDMMEFKLSYEMWRVGRWAVSIPHVEWENEELIFTVHLEEKDNPENLQWDIKKTHMDVIYFRNRWQDSTNLSPISALEISEREVSDEVQEEIRLSAELFLQELVSDDLIGHTQPVFQFLCPLDKLLSEEEHYVGVWGLLSGLAYFLTPGQEEEENSSHHTEATRENLISPHPETTTAENSNTSSEKCTNVTSVTLPTIIISQCDAPSEPCEELEADKETQSFVRSDSSSNESCSQDKTEDFDNPLTSHLKMIIRGLSRSRSQESLASTKSANDEDQIDSDFTQHSSQNGGSLADSTDGPSWRHFGGRTLKREKIGFRMSGGLHKTKGKDQGTLPKGEEPQCLKNQASWEQLEATKAIFDLLKEISGNSILLNIFDAILKPVMPILKKKVNSFLNKMNPTEAQMAVYIDTLREKQWPDCPPAAPAPRTAEEKSETRERAHHLIGARYSNYLILKKTDVESVFNLFQDEKKTRSWCICCCHFYSKSFCPMRIP